MAPPQPLTVNLFQIRLNTRNQSPPTELPNSSIFPNTPLPFTISCNAKKGKKVCVLHDVTLHTIFLPHPTPNTLLPPLASITQTSSPHISQYEHSLSFSPLAVGHTALVTVQATARPNTATSFPITYSLKLFICEHKLTWTAHHDAKWKQNNFEFFKDDGGRESNYIEFFPRLVDCNNSTVTGLRVPLHFSICYDNDNQDKVARQEVRPYT